MRPFHRHPAQLAAIVLGLAACAYAGGASAQNFGNPNSPYYYSSQNYSYGLNLPQVPMPNGQDEIRAADGTACRSNAASNGAYLDVGAIGSQGYGGEFDQGTFYGRVIMPLGETPRRLDCTELYNLEIERLRHEIALVRAGAGGAALSAAPEAPSQKFANAGQTSGALVVKGAAPATKTAGKKDPAWAENGWTTSGWKGAAKVGASDVLAIPAQSAAADNPTFEILPWSNVPAQGPRFLVGVPSARKADDIRQIRVADELPMQHF